MLKKVKEKIIKITKGATSKLKTKKKKYDLQFEIEQAPLHIIYLITLNIVFLGFYSLYFITIYLFILIQILEHCILLFNCKIVASFLKITLK